MWFLALSLLVCINSANNWQHHLLKIVLTKTAHIFYVIFFMH